jgi:putative selenate reductase
MELVPQPLANLIRRIEREPSSTKDRSLFDLPMAKTWRGTPAGLDFSRRFHGERAANVVGPAAGPQTQLAQNIALSYLAGSRILELKTVQILDELKIPRPCIDATNIGFNVEWSQELRIPQSRDEYAKAALLLAAMRRLGLPEGLARGPDEDYLLDLSLGYDLKGIRSEAVSGFVRDMLDASKILDRLLAELPSDVARYRDLSVTPRLINCVTLSTFHGCPAHEIESIAKYLLEELDLHVVVKLNPTLLGFETLQEILHEHLGYRELRVRRETFEKDLQWTDALAMIARLRSVAKRVGRMFGAKLTNTLVVDNHKTFFTEKEMYLSGQPLHVLSTQVLRKLRDALPLIGDDGEPPIVYSFSAGIDQHNFALAAAADLYPVTTCTDLLRPGGYGRLPKYLENLAASMASSGAKTMATYVLRAHGEARRAMDAAKGAIAQEARRSGLTVDEAALLRAADRFEASKDADPRACLSAEAIEAGALDLSLALWVHQAGTHNTRRLAELALLDPRYKKDANTKVPKKIGSQLALFDCVNCDKCVPVCPNDANFSYDAAPISMKAPTWILEEGSVTEGEPIDVAIEEVHQLATFVDFCNACGNCDIFCPEDGGPYVMKPHWFGSAASMEAEARLDGFALESKDAIIARRKDKRVRLAIDRSASIGAYEDEAVEVKVRFFEGGVELLSHRHKTPGARSEVRGADLVVLKALLDGVQTSVNPVSAALSAAAPE